MKRILAVLSIASVLALALALPVEAKRAHPCDNGKHKGDKHCVRVIVAPTPASTLTPYPMCIPAVNCPPGY